MIKIDRLTKRYGPVTAIDGLSLTIEPGETVGLLGPNGAGKTTTIRLMAGLAAPDGGTVRVGSIDPWASPDDVRRSMGVLPDGAALYDRLTVEQNLQFFASMYSLPPTRVVALARAILHRPALLVLDEPTAGLDPAAAASFHDLVRALKAEGVTVVLSSHDMAEVDGLCDQVAVLDRGRLMACDAPARLKATYGRHVVTATVAHEDGAAPRLFEWEIGDPTWPGALDRYRAEGLLLSVHTREASLAEVFIHLTGRELA